ncbi:MAG: hypothetical protein HC871_07320 [Rhizobiales bacterium]|nr:hypothetical protein [Hyphomicrobiales bacterium]
MAAVFPRYSSLDADHFRNVRFTQCIAALSAELEASRELVEHQCLSAIVMVTTVVYLLARVLDSPWALPFVLPVIAIGAASLQHALTLYRHHVRSESLPALCAGIGRLRHAIGEAPDICLDRLVRAGLLPRHCQSMIEDAVFGDYRSRHLSLAMVDLWRGTEEIPLDHSGGDLFHGIVAAIRWPEPPASLPADQLMPLIDGSRLVGCTWFEGYLLVAIPCRQSPFQLGGLFARPEQLIAELLRAASVIQIPHRLIDFMQDQHQEGESARQGRIA